MIRFSKFLLIFLVFPLIGFAQPSDPAAHDFSFNYEGHTYHFYPSLKASWNDDTAIDHLSLYKELGDNHYAQTDHTQTRASEDSAGFHFKTTLDENTFDLIISLNQNNQIQYRVDKITTDNRGREIRKTIHTNSPSRRAFLKTQFQELVGTEQEPPAKTAEECPVQSPSPNDQQIAEQTQNTQDIAEHLPEDSSLPYIGNGISPNDPSPFQARSPFEDFDLKFIEDQTEKQYTYPTLQLSAKEGEEQHTISFGADTSEVHGRGVAYFRRFISAQYFTHGGHDYRFEWSQQDPSVLEIWKSTPIKDKQGRTVRRTPDVSGPYWYRLPPNFKSALWDQPFKFWEDVPNRLKK
ncbi:MAG: hypothetical protein A2Z91_04425 [Deltaproteobacteria bacterium GWA2_38_16]|nr:MAG: hypothetical protein A2Z91_04425 [Deltaproteobacteria bacterium GWA2_38_16]OGQ01751.1 MAG: hypothetical protein A3D19_07755 [Deltaproteobacteria bacterium RIFCSPHIGHO2_02_FULL_38_15]OGQ33432.1 MAG: hypothetical protein A3A72_00625 [Deltaproteobacteria bacterium RIFCSPLOWO2_01_FULL_38_9]HBQ21446.1 hypothetical protein [Deltaproteobacteria bacterium]